GADEGGFTCAVRPEVAECAAARDAQLDTVDGDVAAEPFGEAVGLDRPSGVRGRDGAAGPRRGRRDDLGRGGRRGGRGGRPGRIWPRASGAAAGGEADRTEAQGGEDQDREEERPAAEGVVRRPRDGERDGVHQDRGVETPDFIPGRKRRFTSPEMSVVSTPR